jgi:hypothetical protein
MAETSGYNSIELDWDAVFDGNVPASPARKVWREAVADVTAKGQGGLAFPPTALPQALAQSNP